MRVRSRMALMSLQQNHHIPQAQQNYHISQAIECDLKAQEALDRSVKCYFARLARDYRRLAELAELAELPEGMSPCRRRKSEYRDGDESSRIAAETKA